MRKIRLLSVVLLFFVSACSPQLGRTFYYNKSDIVMQQYCAFLPRGYNAGIASANYPGIIAIVGNDIIFDPQGPGSRLWMPIIGPFKIQRSSVIDIKLSEQMDYGCKIITIKTSYSSYQFYLDNADSFYYTIDSWLMNSNIIPSPIY